MPQFPNLLSSKVAERQEKMDFTLKTSSKEKSLIEMLLSTKTDTI